VPAGAAPAGQTATKAAKFWSDDDTADAILSLGVDEAYLFRWQNSHVTGWVELDGENGPERFKLDTLRARARRTNRVKTTTSVIQFPSAASCW
jgi:hypothetical protein